MALRIIKLFLIVFFTVSALGLLYYKITEEGIRQSRDLVRINDLANLKLVISSTSNNSFCPNSPICSSSSLTSGRAVNGKGWVKVALADSLVTVPYLPVDPLNDKNYHYLYCADKTGWEIVATMESSKFSKLMSQDGGSDPNKYEIGTNFNLFGTGDCFY